MRWVETNCFLDSLTIWAKFGTPYVSVLVGRSIIVLFAGAFYDNIDTIASIVDFGSLYTYFFVHLSYKIAKVRATDEETVQGSIVSGSTSSVRLKLCSSDVLLE